MADINIERKRRSVWPWLLALLLVLVIAAAAWWFLGQKRRSPNAEDERDTTTSPGAMAPAYDSATAPPYPAAPGTGGVPGDTAGR